MCTLLSVATRGVVGRSKQLQRHSPRNQMFASARPTEVLELAPCNDRHRHGVAHKRGRNFAICRIVIPVAFPVIKYMAGACVSHNDGSDLATDTNVICSTHIAGARYQESQWFLLCLGSRPFSFTTLTEHNSMALLLVSQ